MKFSKPIIYTVCLLQGLSAFAVTPDKPAAAKPVETAKSAALILRISKIDGVENPNHKAEIKRYPGKKISFAADLFVKENGKLVAQKASSQDFLWTISTNNRVCDPARASSTCKPTGIDVTQEGISFKVLAGTYGIVFESAADMSVKVTYAKDKKLTDKIKIVNQNELDRIQSNKEFEEKIAAIKEEQSGLGGLFNMITGLTFSSSSSSDDGFYERQAERQQRREREEQLRQLEKSSPSVARDLRAIDRMRDEASRPARSDYGHSGGWNRGDNYGNRGNWNRPASAAPAPYVAPTPAPVVVAPAPAPTPGGHFGGGRDRDGDGQPDRRGGGFGGGRPGRESAPTPPAAPTPAAPGLPSGPGWKPVRQM